MYQEINILPKASASSRESGHMGGGGELLVAQKEMGAASMTGSGVVGVAVVVAVVAAH